MTILVSLQSAVPPWQIPEAAVATIRERFPQHTVLHATTREAREAGLRTCDVAFTFALDADELATARALRWVHTSAVAVETLCLPELVARGIPVTNTRDVQSAPIAEHVLAVVLALAKRLPLALAHQAEAHWGQMAFTGERLPVMLRGRTLGLIGVGTIGRAVAHLARAFDMTVLATRRDATIDDPTLDEVFPPSRLGELLARVDVLVIAAPLTADTRGLIDAPALRRMKRGAILVNVGRAKIVDTDALVQALHDGHLGGACLDVFPTEPLPTEHPLWRCPNVILTPHTAGFRAGHWDEVVEVFSDNVRRFDDGAPLRFAVRPELGY